MILVPLVKLSHGQDLPLPSYATLQSAGLDLMAAVEETVRLNPLKRKLIPTGFSLALPQGYEAQIRPRSGLALKYGVTVLNNPGTIDSDYRGEIQVLLINLGEEEFLIERGMRIAQMVVYPFTQIRLTEVMEHGPEINLTRKGGFGSTGIGART